MRVKLSGLELIGHILGMLCVVVSAAVKVQDVATSIVSILIFILVLLLNICVTCIADKLLVGKQTNVGGTALFCICLCSGGIMVLLSIGLAEMCLAGSTSLDVTSIAVCNLLCIFLRNKLKA